MKLGEGVALDFGRYRYQSDMQTRMHGRILGTYFPVITSESIQQLEVELLAYVNCYSVWTTAEFLINDYLYGRKY